MLLRYLGVLLIGTTVGAVDLGDLANLKPEEYGLNCTPVEFLSLYLSCLSTYSPENAIVDCTVQCGIVDEFTDCTNEIDKDALSVPCRTSLSEVMRNTPEALRKTLFGSDTIATCNLDLSSIIAICPDLEPFNLPSWAEWGDFSACEGQSGCQTRVRTRQCVNQLSYAQPPEVTSGCDGENTETEECVQDGQTACVTSPPVVSDTTETNVTAKGNKPLAGAASSIWNTSVANYLLLVLYQFVVNSRD